METDSTLCAIVAFPLLDARDRQWIESIRAKHDPQVDLIGAHFTLVFPTVMSRRIAEAHAARVAGVTEPIRFVLRRAAVVPDAIGAGGHTFLLPDEGRDEIRQLHDRLYEGPLHAHLPKHAFTPHMTVAARPAIEPLDHLAAEINAAGQSIRGSISEIVLVEVTSAAIQPLIRLPLGRPDVPENLPSAVRQQS